MPKGIWMWDRHCVPFLGFSQIARILFFLRQPHMWLSFLGIFFFESCFVLRFPGIMCSSKPPPAALCTQNNSTTSIPTSNTTSLNSANVFPGGTHALSIIPSIIWHPIIWSVLSIWGTFFSFLFFFSANSPTCNMSLSASPSQVLASSMTGSFSWIVGTLLLPEPPHVVYPRSQG